MMSSGVPLPPLPDFIAERFPFQRRCLPLHQKPHEARYLHLVDHGARDSPVLLLVHGNPTWSFLWRKVMTQLGDFRCIAPDLLGLGLSSRLSSPRDHSLASHADALAEMVKSLDVPRLILVGQDWGGPIATAVGARLPERIAGVVLGNTSVLAPRRPRGTAFHRFSRLPLVSDLVFRVLGFPLRSLHRLQGDPESLRGEVARAYRWPLSSWRDRATPLALARMVPNSLDHPSYPELQRSEAWLRSFEGPMALVWGQKDPILGRALNRHRKAFPQAGVTLTDAGHFLQEEVPREFAAAIRTVATQATL